MRRSAALAVCLLFSAVLMNAQMTRDAKHVAPNGKGWGEENPNAPAEQQVTGYAVTTGNGINYHGGPVMAGNPVNVYFIWYGNWSASSGSNSQGTVSLINSLFAPSGGTGGSGYSMINSTYGSSTTNVSGNENTPPTGAYQVSVGYTNGTRLSDNTIRNIVSNQISSGALPNDTNGVYFVLTSSDVTATSGFCTRYCGWHTHSTILGSDIKYAFVGNPDRCSSACEAQTTSPNGNSGADGMASIMAHEAMEAISDPDLNAWYDSSGAENADKCAWKFGPVQSTSSGAHYNQTFGSHHWLIQMNWENARGGGCDQQLGGTFYTN